MTAARAWVEVPLPDEAGVEVFLRARAGRPGGRPVLLVHGASASSDTFLVPGGRRSLVDALEDAGHAVYLLDWRTSFRVVDRHYRRPRPDRAPDERFLLEAAARHDLPRALDTVAERHPGESVAVVAHCLGAGMASIALALGLLDGRLIRRIVLMTLGLFYRVPVEGLLKAQDHLLERLASLTEHAPLVSPTDEELWAPPHALHAAFDFFQRSPFAETSGGTVFHRLTFMFGRVYHPENLAPELHDDDALRRQFGSMHLYPYIEGTQFIRRGWAAPFDAARGCRWYIDDPRAFRAFPMTLLTGGRNRLWHPDGMERMYAFLRRGDRSGAAHLEKRVLPGYGHQDLLWGRSAHADVYPLIVHAVR